MHTKLFIFTLEFAIKYNLCTESGGTKHTIEKIFVNGAQHLLRTKSYNIVLSVTSHYHL